MLKKFKLLLTVSIMLTLTSAADTAGFVLVDKKAGIKLAPLILFPNEETKYNSDNLVVSLKVKADVDISILRSQLERALNSQYR